MFDLPALIGLLTRLQRREITLVEVETATASPFASSLLFDYVATYMYEGDTPNAERRAAALSLDRDLLRELLGQEELRDLIDPAALAAVEADLQWLSDERRVAGRDALHDLLRVVGDLSTGEVAARVLGGVSADAMLAALQEERRAVSVRVGGEQRWIDAGDAGLYRDALGVAPPGGLPDAFLEDVPDALLRLVRRYCACHGPFTGEQVRERFAVDVSAVLRVLERDGELVQGELRPGGNEREWCHPDVLRRLRRASLAALRREVEPVDELALARFLPRWQGVDRWPAGGSGAGIDRLRDVLVPLQGLALPAEIWEKEVLPRRIGGYSAAWMDQLCAAGEVVWIGAGALGRSGRVGLYFRDDLALIGPPAVRGEEPASPVHDAIRERLGRGACFFGDLLEQPSPGGGSGITDLTPEAVQEALWDLVWAGEVTNDAFAPLRAGRLALARSASSVGRGTVGRSRPGRFAGRAGSRGGAAAQLQGRWSLTASLLGERDGAAGPGQRRRAQAELLLERYGILTREQVLAEGLPGGFSAVYSELTQLETLGVARRGYFVEGLGGAQFALAGAVERLRERRSLDDPPVVLSALDPAQPYGAALAWPAGLERTPARRAGAFVVLAAGTPILYLERGGRGLQTLVAGDDERLAPSLATLVDYVRSGRSGVRRLALEKVDGGSPLSSPLGGQLLALGFQEGPRRLTLSA